MALRRIITDEDETLRKRSREVEKIDDRLQVLLDDMIETMYANNGIGLAGYGGKANNVRFKMVKLRPESFLTFTFHIKNQHIVITQRPSQNFQAERLSLEKLF